MNKPHLLGFCALYFLLFFTACSEAEKDIEVQSIAISQPSAEMEIGETLYLRASVSPSNAAYDSIIWTSTKTSVATVSDSGLVTALTEGSTTIIAMAGGKTASCSVTVVKGFVAVSSVSLNKTSLELFEGDTETLSAKVFPDDATDKTISWSSSNTRVATVKDGTIAAVKEGEATITAKAGERSASCKVVVISYPLPEAIDLGLSVKWASFNLFAFNPEEYGDYYAWGSIITYYESLDPLIWLSGKEAGYSWSSYNYCRGSYNTLTKYCSDPSYGYNGFTDNKSVLDPNDDVAYCALGDKWRMPTISELEELMNKCSWKWTFLNGVKGYKVTGSNGNSIFLPAAGWWLEKTLNDVDSAGMYWSSTSLGTSAKYLLDFSKQGIVCNGAAFITGCTIRPVYGDHTSSIPVQSVSLDKSQLDLTVGQTHTLTATVKPSNATDKSVTWSSSNTSVASVSSSGVISAKAVGNVTITVKTNDGGKTATCSVKVSTSQVAVTGVSLNKSSISMTIGETQTLIASVSPSNATNKSVTWSSSNNAVATVSSSGVISARVPGNATITVKTNDGGKTATCAVKVSSSDTFSVPDAIDLGLSVYWASFNLGASKPEEFGNFYAWGETEPKDDYSWKTYKWCLGDKKSLIKYVNSVQYSGLIDFYGFPTTDDKEVLEPEDDAAHVKLGGKWRMPTCEEILELLEKCTFTYYSINRQAGVLIKGPNSNSIFIPEAGIFWETSYYYPYQYHSFIWSSTVFYDELSHSFSFNTGEYLYEFKGRGRELGGSIRPVCDR